MKKLFLYLGGLIKGAVKRLFVSRKKTSDGRKIIKNQLLLLFLVVIFGYWAGHHFVWLVWPVAKGKTAEEVSLMQRLTGKAIPLAGKTEAGDFLFSSFEDKRELGAWKAKDAVLEISDRYPADGAHTLRMLFEDRETQPSLILANLLRSRKGGSDWSRYKSLGFTVFSPAETKLSLSVKITDLWGRQYLDTFQLKPGGVFIEVQVSDLEKLINPAQVDTVVFQFKKGGQSSEVYLDHIRLIQSDADEKATQEAAAASAAESGAAPYFDYDFQSRRQAWIYRDPAVQDQLIRIPFGIKNESSAACRLCAVEGGIPFPAGEIKSVEHLKLHDASGQLVPFQANVLARWPDDSIKWAGLSFDATLAPGQGTGLFLDYGRNMKGPVFESPLRYEEDEDAVTVFTGALWLRFNKKQFSLYDEARIDSNFNGIFEKEEVLSANASLHLSFNGQEYSGSNNPDYQLLVEEAGPHRLTVRSEGWMMSGEGEKFCKVILRYTFYAGKSHFKLAHTLVYTGYPANLYNDEYRGKNLPENEMVESFGLKLPVTRTPSTEAFVDIGQNESSPLRFLSGDKTAGLMQLEWGASILENGAEKKNVPYGMAGWIDFVDKGYGLGVKIRKARENFPKALRYDPAAGAVAVELWPKEAGPLDLQTTEAARGPGAIARGSAFGLAKTHEMLIYMHRGDAAEAAERLTAFEERLVIRTNPYWIDATGAAGRLAPAAGHRQDQEMMLERLFDWAARQPAAFKWYGMLNFGDTLSWWRNEDEERKYETYGWHPVGRWGWYNSEGPGVHTGALLQFMRTGKWKYFSFGENLARHIMDIDTVHYNTVAEDPRLKRVISDVYSKVGSMHRHNGDHWGGRNDEASHTNIQGLMHYYYLTADPRVLEVAEEAGEFYLGQHFTYSGHPDQAPLRALANALWGHMLLYEATGRSQYIRSATKLIEALKDGGQMPGGAFYEMYNPERRKWSGEKSDVFMAWYLVPALIKYHEMTESEDARKMFLDLMEYFLAQKRPVPEVTHGFAYAYMLTRDAKFTDAVEKGLAQLIEFQRNDVNPVLDGLIYDKPIYHRPNIFLASAPYGFGALDEEYYRIRGRRR